MKAKRYVALVLIAVALVPVSIVSFNLAIDPYDFEGMLGLRPIPPVAPVGMRTTQGPFSGFWYGKVYNVRWFKPDAAVFGSSSAGNLIEAHELGRDPHHRFGRRIFDFSVGGPSIGMLKQLLLHTEALHPLNQAILELNFFMFNADRQRLRPSDFALAPFAHLPGYRRRFLETMLEMCVTQEETRDSADVLVRRALRGKGIDELEAEWAARFWPTPAAAAVPAVRQRTAQDYRNEILALDRFIYIGLFHDHPAATFRFADDTGYDTFDEFRAILAESHRRGTSLHLYLSPSHARMGEIITIEGRWPLFEEWKRRVAAIVAEDASTHPGHAFPLWDFSGYNSVTMEPFPPATEPARTYENYLDTVHFSRRTADLIVDRMLDFHETGRVIPDDFGVRLTPANVERMIVETRAAKASYEAAHRSEIDDLRAVLGTVQ